MPTLPNFHHFAGSHWETGTLHNVYAYLGVKAPHTGEPYSEALLLVVSGGIVMGYFSFAYEGFDPQCNILTRNTFDPMETLLARLGVVQTVQQTAKADKAVALLVDALADGTPAIVLADHWSLPYNALAEHAQMWGMMPIVVYGYEADADRIWIADRASVPLTVSTGQLAAARGRAKKKTNTACSRWMRPIQTSWFPPSMPVSGSASNFLPRSRPKAPPTTSVCAPTRTGQNCSPNPNSG